MCARSRAVLIRDDLLAVAIFVNGTTVDLTAIYSYQCRISAAEISCWFRVCELVSFFSK